MYEFCAKMYETVLKCTELSTYYMYVYTDRIISPTTADLSDGNNDKVDAYHTN